MNKNDHAIPGNYADLDYSGIHQFTDEDNGDFGSFEVFQGSNYFDAVDPESDPDGWYWWACFTGCLPDGDPIGPFPTSADAYHNAQGF